MTILSLRLTFAATLATALAVSAGPAIAQPTLSRGRAPGVSGSIRTFVDRLYSADPRARAEAACQIGRRATEAVAAIAILLSMLSDDVAVAGIDCEMGRDRSAWALGEIEDPSALDELRAAASDSNGEV